jgi:predicted transcriptional regulator
MLQEIVRQVLGNPCPSVRKHNNLGKPLAGFSPLLGEWKHVRLVFVLCFPWLLRVSWFQCTGNSYKNYCLEMLIYLLILSQPMVSYNFRKVTVVKINKPREKNLNRDLQWFSNSLGLFSERDKERSCFRIFVELVRAARNGYPLSSDELALKTNLSRGTVVHHLNRLIESGLIVSHNGRYLLRDTNLENLVEEVKKDLIRVFDDLKMIATELDEELGSQGPCT